MIVRRILAVAVLVVVAFPAPVRADTTLDVEVGFDGFVRPGEVVPILVEVDADRLVRGTLSASNSETGTQRTELAVEIPGGSVKRFVLAVGAPAAIDRPTFDIALRDDDGRVVASEKAVGSAPPSGQELVGLLPGVLGSRPLPGTAPLAVDVGTARFVPLTTGLLGRPELLRSLSTIGTGTDDLAALAPAEAAGLDRWVAEGGHLLVDSAPGAALQSLPEAWHPDDAVAVPAGLGAVRATGGAMAEGRWNGLVAPTARVTEEATRFSSFAPHATYNGLLAALGTRAPRISTLIWPLVVYAVVAGPVLYLLLRRRRMERWMWIVVPALAVVVTLGSYGAAISLRGGAKSAHMTLLTHTPSGGSAVSYVAVTSPGGGTTTVSFPEDWELTGGQLDTQGFGPPSETTADAVYAPDAFTGRVRLNPAEVGLASGTGPASVRGGLVVSAKSDGTEISGTVRNASSYDVQQAAVLVGKDHVSLGRIEAGAEKPWTLQATPQQPHFTLPGRMLWPQASGFAPPVQDDAVNYDLWRLGGARFGSDFLTTGVAVAVGWTNDHEAVASVTGTLGSPDGHSLLVGRAHVSQTTGTLEPLAIRREQIRGPRPTDPEPGTDELASDEAIVLRFTLPVAPRSPLVLQGPDNLGRLEAWADGAWQEVFVSPGSQQQVQPGGPRAIPFPQGPQRFGPGGLSGPEVPMADHELPANAFDASTRTVYLRITQDLGTGLHAGWGYTLREQP